MMSGLTGTLPSPETETSSARAAAAVAGVAVTPSASAAATTMCVVLDMQPLQQPRSRPAGTRRQRLALLQLDLQAGGAPDREPPGEIRFDREIGADRAACLELQRVVPPVAGARRERVERAA